MISFTKDDVNYQAAVVGHLTDRINELNEELGREQRILTAMTKARKKHAA